MDLVELLNASGTKLEDITKHLDSLAEAERVRQVMALGKKEQMKLWDLARIPSLWT